MLAPNAQADQASGDPAEERQAAEEAQWPGKPVEDDLADDERRQDPIVNSFLDALDDPRRK